MKSQILKLSAMGIIVIAAIIVLVLALVVFFIVRNRKKEKQDFYTLVDTFYTAPSLLREKLHERFSTSSLMRLLPHMVELSEEKDIPLVTISGIDSLLYSKMISKGNYKIFTLIVKHAVETSIYACFYYALKHPQMLEHIFTHPKYSDIEIMRYIALTWDKKPFDTKKAFNLLQDRIDLLTELTGDQQAKCRFFAASILVNSKEEKISRLLISMLNDPDYNVRKTIIGYMDNKLLEDKLKTIIEKDPNIEVREEAWKKMSQAEKEQLINEQLTDMQALHVLEQLNPSDKNHQKFAFTCLKSNNEELAFYAAHFLCREPGSILDHIFITADSRDKEGFEEAKKVLIKAANYEATAFLNSVSRIEDRDTIILALRILRERGEEKHILTMTRKLITASVWDKNPEVYKELITTILAREDLKSLAYIKKFLTANKANTNIINATLELISKDKVCLIEDVLIKLFSDPAYKNREKLEELLSSGEKTVVVPVMLDTISNKRKPLMIRKSAIRVLAKMQLPYCVSLIIEELPTLSAEEAAELTEVLTQYPEDVISRNIEKYIETYDARTISSLIASLPVEYKKKYSKQIQEKISAPDPMIRISAAYSIAEISDSKQLQNIEKLLHDPDISVRTNAAKILAEKGNKKIYSELDKILKSDEEVDEVKLSILEGLGNSDNPEKIKILLDTAESNTELEEYIIRALSKKMTTDCIKALAEELKNRKDRTRELIKKAFKAQGEIAENKLIELLKQDIAGIKDIINELLEETGLVDIYINRLNNKNIRIRKEAATMLSEIASEHALRGLVLAAGDPEEEIRIITIKAISKLKNAEGKDILDKLLKDPSKKVRKYTKWALERQKLENKS